MNGFSLWQMVVQSVTDPRGVARALIARDLPRQALWMALIAVSALGAVLTALPAIGLTGTPEGLTPLEVQMLGLIRQPVILALVSFGGAAAFAVGFFWTGRAFGGTGRFEDVLAMLVWLQVLQLALQVILLVLGFVVPPVAGLVSLIALPLGLWIAANLIDVAHGFESLLKSLGVMLSWVVGLSLGLTMLLTLAGVGAGGMPGNV